MVLDALLIARCLACAFFAVLFIQSGLDKVFDYKGNLDWMSPHFANSPFKGGVPVLLRLLTLLELASGVASAIAVWAVAAMGPHWIPVAAIGLCGLTLLSLFLGQRLAKDYAGAATIAAYFGVLLISLYLMGVGFDVSLPS